MCHVSCVVCRVSCVVHVSNVTALELQLQRLRVSELAGFNKSDSFLRSKIYEFIHSVLVLRFTSTCSRQWTLESDPN